MSEAAEITIELGRDTGQEKKSVETVKIREIVPIITNKEQRTSKEGRDFEFYRFILPTGEPIRVVFKGREETIDSDVIGERHTVIIGQEPQHLSQEKYSAWQVKLNGKDSPTQLEHSLQNVRLSEYVKDGGLTIIVNQTPESLTEAALILGASDPRVRELYHQSRNFNYSDDLIGLIDSSIAAKTVKSELSSDLLPDSHDSEALLLASLLGDQQATDTLSRLKDRYQKNYQSETQAVEEEYQDFVNEHPVQSEGSESVKIENLVAVHVTRFYPTYDQKLGKWKVKNLLDATEGKVARTTIHFSLNHSVASHMYGNWQEASQVIVVPVKDLIAQNGLPASLNPVDTYWNLNPGQDLILPESAWILAPGPTNQDSYSETSGVHMRHKGPDRGVHKANYPVYKTTKLTELKRREDSNLLYTSPKGSPEKEEQVQINKEINQELNAVEKNRNQAVEKLITDLGYEVKPGGTDTWGSDYKVLDHFSLLSQSLGTRIGGHFYSTENEAENMMRDHLASIKEGHKVNTYTVSDDLKESFREIWPKLPAQQRRAAWVIGLI